MSRARDLANTTTALLVDGTVKLDGNYPVGTANVALGDTVLDSLTTGGYNTAVGHNALTANTEGYQNAAFGRIALTANTTGVYNSAFGSNSMGGTTTGTRNAAFGSLSLETNTTGSYNTSVGHQSLFSNTTASDSVAVGYQAGYANTTNGGVTYVGRLAGYQATGSFNSFYGYGSGSAITTGSKNTILGRYDGNYGGLDIRIANNHIVLSDGDGNPRIYWTETGMLVQTTNYNSFRTAIFQNSNNTSGNGTFSSLLGSNCNNTNSYHFIANIVGTGDRMYVYGNGNVVNTNNAYGALSDEKLKENIVDSGSQWDDIKALRIRKYSMKEDALDAPNKLGVIAQELEAAGMGGLVFESTDRDEDGNILDTSTKQVIYSVLYMKAVKALQEAMERIETLETENVAIKARLDALEAV